MKSKPNLWQILQSVLGALFGVQSSEVRERDFVHGQPWWVYLAVGILVVIILVLLLVGMAKILVGL